MTDATLRAEQSLLGGLLLDNSARVKVNGVSARDFAADENRLIFNAIIDELDDSGVADVVTVFQRLVRNGEAERAGGILYLNSLAQNTPGAANVERYADMVHKAAQRRMRIGLYTELMAAANKGDSDSEAAILRQLDPARWAIESDAKQCEVWIGGILTVARAMPDPELVAEPFAVRGQLVTLTAKPNHGKSTFSLAHAVHHVLQMPFGSIRPRSDGLVVYVSAEDQESTGVRAQAQCASLGLTSEQIATVDRKLRWATLNTSVTIGEVVERIRADTKDAAIDIVYVDTGIAMFAGDDENDNMQLQVFATSCRELTRLPGRPWVALMWHPVKGANGAAALQPRGGSSLNGTTDGNLTLWAEDDATELHYLKARWPRFEPIKFALKPFPLVLSSGKWIDIPLASPITDEADEQRGDAKTQRREKLLLAMTGSTQPLSLRQLQLIAGAGKSTVDRDFKAMSESKPPLVHFDTINDRYAPTEAGIKRAAAIRKRDSEAYRNAQDPG